MSNWIVVVDDDTVSLANARAILSEKGIKVSCLPSGKNLLKFIEDNTPDLIMLDIMMPDMDGFEVYHALRRKEEKIGRRPTPVVFLTGDNDSETEKRGLNAGASDFIYKPFDKEVLLTRAKIIIENNRRMDSLMEEATTDKLTGLLNKVSGTERVKELCKTETGALMILDLDNFKLVNDLYGHDMGDQVLIAFADIVKHCTRRNDVVSRIGGDEFLIFEEGAGEGAVSSMAERLNVQLEDRCRKLMGDDFNIPIGISIGAAMVSGDGKEYESLFQFADQSLYRVKQKGKHGYEIYDNPQITEAGEDDLEYDMARITQMVKERNAANSALFLGQEAFTWSYRYILRYCSRYNRVATKVLFSITTRQRTVVPDDVMRAFSEVLLNNLRKSDIIMQNKASQFFLLLPEYDEEALKNAIKRILDEWNKEYEGRNIIVEYLWEVIHPQDISEGKK